MGLQEGTVKAVFLADEIENLTAEIFLGTG